MIFAPAGGCSAGDLGFFWGGMVIFVVWTGRGLTVTVDLQDLAKRLKDTVNQKK